VMVDSVLHLYISNEESIEYRMVNVCSCRFTVGITSNLKGVLQNTIQSLDERLSVLAGEGLC